MIQGKWSALEVKNANYCLQKTTPLPPQKKIQHLDSSSVILNFDFWSPELEENKFQATKLGVIHCKGNKNWIQISSPAMPEL